MSNIGSGVQGCVITAQYKRFWKVTKTELPNGPTTESREDYTPETIEPRTFIVPGCIPPEQSGDVSAPMFKDDMAALSHQQTWTPSPSVWIPTPHVLVRLQIAEELLDEADMRTSLEASLKSVLNMAETQAHALGTQQIAEGSKRPGAEE
jgi:hypothetical protein